MRARLARSGRRRRRRRVSHNTVAAAPFHYARLTSLNTLRLSDAMRCYASDPLKAGPNHICTRTRTIRHAAAAYVYMFRTIRRATGSRYNPMPYISIEYVRARLAGGRSPRTTVYRETARARARASSRLHTKCVRHYAHACASRPRI